MKYFTPELWLAVNSGSRARVVGARRKWMAAQSRYQLQLRDVLGAFGVAARRFFTDVSLHDGTLLGVSVQFPGRRSAGMVVTCDVEAPDGSGIYRLSFGEVERFEVDRLKAASLGDEHDKSLGTWGYDELTRREAGAYRYEVLFSSGATLTVEFGRFRVVKRKHEQV